MRSKGPLNRRQLLTASLAVSFMLAPRAAAAAASIPIADMHRHVFFRGPGGVPLRPLARAMADGSATLVAWSLVGDLPWIRPTPSGLKQKGGPHPGEARAWFRTELARITEYIASQRLKIVRTVDDLEKARAGDPHVVLAVEGAAFVEEDLGELRTAHELGVRHLQLVHVIANPLGDSQTARPVLGGLSALGRRVIEECNQLGILVDLAHCAEGAVHEALAVSKVPMVWSHGSVAPTGTPDWSLPQWRARQLSLQGARAIAAKGGVVGLWALSADVGPSWEGYAARLGQLAEWLGEDGAAFGTDLEGLAAPAFGGYGDLRRVLDAWQRQGMGEGKIRKLAIDNYARVLGRALAVL